MFRGLSTGKRSGFSDSKIVMPFVLVLVVVGVHCLVDTLDAIENAVDALVGVLRVGSERV